MKEIKEIDRITQNKFNKVLNRRFHVTPANNIFIQGVKNEFTLTPEIQEEILQCLANIEVNRELGIEPNFLEKLAIEVLFKDTY